MPSKLWLPGQRKRASREAVVRPFRGFARELDEMGFKCGMDHNQEGKYIRIRMVPYTDRARAACRAAGGNEQGMEVGALYEDQDAPGDVLYACVEKGRDELKRVLGA